MPSLGQINKSRVGESGVTTYGQKMTIIRYGGTGDVDVLFDDKTIVKTQYVHFKNGQVKNPNLPILYGVGYLGQGEYDRSSKEKYIFGYNVWSGILRRCYSQTFQKVHKSYIGCSVDDEWHCFQNFASWYKDNFTIYGDEKMCVDKDILVKSNKIYSKDTCVIVDNRINNLFVKNNASRGNLPIGVIYNKQAKMFSTSYHRDGGVVFLGYHTTPEAAFYIYKEFKEKYIKEVADEYKAKYPNFPQRLYDAMYSWEVDIND